jgi:hypothetical protein
MIVEQECEWFRNYAADIHTGAGASADGDKNFAPGMIIRIASHQVDQRIEERLERAPGGYRL